MSESKKRPHDWTVDEVVTWIATIPNLPTGLSTTFKTQEICGKALSMIDIQDLKDLGVEASKAMELIQRVNKLFDEHLRPIERAQPPNKQDHSVKQPPVLPEHLLKLTPGECLH